MRRRGTAGPLAGPLTCSLLALSLLAVGPGCSLLVDARANAGIPALEEAAAPVAGAARGAKYAGWILGAPLSLALAPLAALAWATPWVDLPLAVDLASAPAVGLGYLTQALVGGPTWGVHAALAEEPATPPATWRRPAWVPPGFVLDHLPAPRAPRPARALAPADRDYYAPPPGAAEALGEALAAALGEEGLAGEAPPPLALEALGLDSLGLAADLELFPARGASGPRPLLLLTPPIDATFAARYQARWAAERGVHAALIAPRGVLLDPPLDPAGLEAKLRAGVVTARAVLAALAARPEVGEQVGYLGISAGGIFGAALLGAEPRIDRAVLMLAGGDLPRIVAASDEPTVRAYREAWAARGLAGEALAARLRDALRTEPLRLALHVDPRRVLLFVAGRDGAVPTDCGLALRHALGDPETYLLAGGHRSAGLCFGFVLRRTQAHLFPPP